MTPHLTEEKRHTHTKKNKEEIAVYTEYTDSPKADMCKLHPRPGPSLPHGLIKSTGHL